MRDVPRVAQDHGDERQQPEPLSRVLPEDLGKEDGDSMKLFLIEYSGWGVDFQIVRAVDEAQLRERFGVVGDAKVTELNPEGETASLWEYENSPDSRPGD